MKTRSLFLVNLIISVLYLLIHPFLSGIIHTIVLLLIVLLFLYTSEKIRDLNQGNPFLFSRAFIMMSCIFLIGTLFGRYESEFMIRLTFILVALAAEAYELIIKHKEQTN